MFKYNKFLFAVFLCSSGLVFSMGDKENQVPSSTGVNQRPIDDIVASVQAGLNTTPVRNKADRALNNLQNSGSNSKRKAAAYLAEEIIGNEIDPSKSLEEQNKDKLNFFKTREALKSQRLALAQRAASLMGSPDRKALQAVNVGHVSKPRPVFDLNKRMTGVSGGHDFQHYPEGIVHPESFLSQDGTTFGAMIYAGDKKTVVDQKTFGVDSLSNALTPDEILDTTKTSKTIARNPRTTFKVSKAGNDRFYGSFQDDQNSLLVTTQFPVLVVDGEKETIDGRIKLGSFGSITKNYAGRVPAGSYLDNTQDIIVNKIDYNRMIKYGVPLETHNNKKVLVDITDPFEKSFPDKLQARGLSKFPSKLYAYGYANLIPAAKSSTPGAPMKPALQPRIIPGQAPGAPKKASKRGY